MSDNLNDPFEMSRYAQCHLVCQENSTLDFLSRTELNLTEKATQVQLFGLNVFPTISKSPSWLCGEVGEFQRNKSTLMSFVDPLETLKGDGR